MSKYGPDANTATTTNAYSAEVNDSLVGQT